MTGENASNLLLESPTPSVVRITINRPQALNALNSATLTELGRAVDQLKPEVRVVVITGAGEKAFVAGADIREMADFTALQGAALSRLGHDVFARFEASRAVFIAEVNGFALGGGCELMLACDFAIAGANAKLGQPEVSLGVTPGFGGTTRLVRRVGAARAKQLLFTGQVITADEALSMGLVNVVVPAAELRAKVDAIANKIAENAPVAVDLVKKSVRLAEESDLDRANAFEEQVFGLSFATEDQKEGMRAFLDKRKPSWKAR